MEKEKKEREKNREEGEKKGGGGRTAHLGVLFDRYEHSFLKFDVLCGEKVQVSFRLLFRLVFLDSIDF